jgi:hypothetical protein
MQLNPVLRRDRVTGTKSKITKLPWDITRRDELKIIGGAMCDIKIPW